MNSPKRDLGMQFETSMMFHFGDKAHMIASYGDNAAGRKKWFLKFATQLRSEVLSLDTDAKHKERLLDDIDDFLKEAREKDPLAWSLVFHLIRILGLMLGVFDVSGSKRRWVSYAREPLTFYSETTGDIGQIVRIQDAENIIRIRADTVRFLQSKGVEIERIALVMNTSVYALKKELNGRA